MTGTLDTTVAGLAQLVRDLQNSQKEMQKEFQEKWQMMQEKMDKMIELNSKKQGGGEKRTRRIFKSIREDQQFLINMEEFEDLDNTFAKDETEFDPSTGKPKRVVIDKLTKVYV